MKISVEKIIEIVVREVISELMKRGYEINFSTTVTNPVSDLSGNTKSRVEMNMGGYKTPVLTENNILLMGQGITEIIIPEKTIITPGARDLIKKKKIIITHKN